MKKVKRVNNEVKKSIATKNNASVNNAVKDRIDNANYDRSKRLVKAIKTVSFKYSAVRSAILAYVANEKNMSFADKDQLIAVLRKSKKDTTLYHVLCDLADFSYKQITTKDQNAKNVTNVVKAYSIKSVLESCDLYLQISNVELTANLISAIKFEREKTAIVKLKKSIEKLQNDCNVLSATIESLSKDQNADLISEYSDQLKVKSNTLKKRITLLEYVNVASNRSNIK